MTPPCGKAAGSTPSSPTSAPNANSWPDNTTEIEAVETDAGRHLGYVRAVGRRRTDAVLDEPITTIPVEYVPTPLLRSDDR